MKNKDIIDAYCRIRKIDNTIPDDVLDFMKDAALEKLNSINNAIRVMEAMCDNISNTEDKVKSKE